MDISFLYKTKSGQLLLLCFISFIYLIENVWNQISILALSVSIVCYLHLKNSYAFWEQEGIPFITATFPFGYMKDVLLQRTSISEEVLNIYKSIGDRGYTGAFSFLQPQLFIKDLEIVKLVLIKDFSNFTDRGTYVNTKVDPLTGNLFFLKGQLWKNLRAKISPTFTSGKLKTMYSTVKDVGVNLKDYTIKVNSTSDSVDIKDLAGRYGLEVISSVALGIDGNNFNETNTEMRHVTHLFSAPSLVQIFRILCTMLSQKVATFLNIRFAPKAVEEYFFKITRDTINYRNKHNVKRNDFLHLLMGLSKELPDDSKSDSNDISLTLTEIAAQSFVFVIAGYETTSATLCFLLYELALNPDIQDRLIQELDAAETNVQYEELMNLPYLDMVLKETLRKYPPVPLLQRECINDYQLPDGTVIKSGTQCIIPVIGIHRDQTYYPDPEKFNPERFCKDKVKDMKSHTFIPFGEGPRICIGYRFAILQLKLAVATFLSRFMVTLSEKTPVPVTLEKKSFVYNAEGGLFLRLIDRH